MLLVGDYLNTQLYSECQLVTLINAANHLGEKPIVQRSEEYERLVDLTLSRHGAALHPERAMDYLRIEAHNTDPSWKTLLKHIKNGNPVEYSVWHASCGFHSVLVVGASAPFGAKVTVTNFDATDDKMRMDWVEFHECWTSISNFEARYFCLTKARELDILHKDMTLLGYSSQWFDYELKCFDGLSAHAFVSADRSNIKKVRAEIDRRWKWTPIGRTREMLKIARADI